MRRTLLILAIAGAVGCGTLGVDVDVTYDTTPLTESELAALEIEPGDSIPQRVTRCKATYVWLFLGNARAPCGGKGANLTMETMSGIGGIFQNAGNAFLSFFGRGPVPDNPPTSPDP